MFNIVPVYKDGHVGMTLLGQPVEYADAIRYARWYRSNYIGKPYPNGKGFYGYRQFRIVREEQ